MSLVATKKTAIKMRNKSKTKITTKNKKNHLVVIVIHLLSPLATMLEEKINRFKILRLI